MSTTTNGTDGGTLPPNITLYTNHGCPYAHRAHIALAELGLPYGEMIIDLNTPRPQWYLDINPRGLVPTIKYSPPGVLDQEPATITESQIVAQFLVDAHPSPLQPASSTGALVRARQAWLIKTWEDKIAAFLFATVREPDLETRQRKCVDWAAALEKEIEPHFAHLTSDAPFFGGSEQLTFVEVMLAPFLLRVWALAEDGELVPGEFLTALEKLPGLKRWRTAIMGKESVMGVYDEKAIVKASKVKMQKMQEGMKK